MKITIVGLGSGDISSISLKAYKILTSFDNIYLRTEKHPVVEYLTAEGMGYKSFDYIYDKSNDFESCYKEIAEIMIQKALSDQVVYAVPGHPCVAEKSVKMLMKLCEEKKIEIEIVSSTSFLDDMFVFLNFDPSEGFTLLDALDFDEKKIGLYNNLVFTQVHNRLIASDLKLKLLEVISENAEIIIFKAAGIKGLEQKTSVKLYELDRSEFEFDHLTSVFIPFPYLAKNESLSNFVETIEVLRGENGCPWDKEQTRESLIPQFYEELDEFNNAVNNNDIDNIVEELGDLLLHIVLQAQIGKEEELFDINDIISGISEKIIRRHPHVFGQEQAFTKEDVNVIWERIKKEEKLIK
ncbi:MazG nucleotide pyrophosphohydrolase domain-containing protein [Proteocatella sphenisci]|uniref:MazG nucleotide pyrophosphohydrolase domain-containing protein n=1 Tax=Proteocatella sphenisci TaxID=181070 RepID=UPI0004B877DE|nr:MazG nucleotide pyrophosphohydrolase domain-containing protein [Proteocatella sphenisci]